MKTLSPGYRGYPHTKVCLLGIAVILALVTRTDGNTALSPRLILTDQAVTRMPMPQLPVGAVFGQKPDSLLLAGQDKMMSFSFQGLLQVADVCVAPAPSATSLCGFQRSDLSCDAGPNINITLVHQTEDKHVFVCGTVSRETSCCTMQPAQGSSEVTGLKMISIIANIREFIIEPGEPSVLVESDSAADLYITYSGAHENVGLYKFGKNRVSPLNEYKEQYYVELVLSRREEDPSQDEVFAFYNEKRRDSGLSGDMWVPFVSRVCAADAGGSKQILQFIWTSQLDARLLCGDSASGHRFSRLVGVATVRAPRWQDTTVYALFTNEWNMSAICIYTIKDMDDVFRSSPFKDRGLDRHRECVPDSTKLSSDVLRTIEKGSELLQPVRPQRSSSPLIFTHHSYTHISVDSFHNSSGPFAVLFLSLRSGAVHKVLHSTSSSPSQAFVIAAYLLFPQRVHVLAVMLHSSSKKLYVVTKSELVQLEVANCSHYGDQCEDCILARDPYCGWNGTHCTPEGPLQDVSGGDYSICRSASDAQNANSPGEGVSIKVPPKSKFFLQCPVTSLHAQYVWQHPGGPTRCSSKEQCVLLLDSMEAELQGEYRCESTEAGHTKVIQRYQLEQDNQRTNRGPGRSWSPTLWLLLTAVWFAGPE